jgi:hypothetical protein
VCVFLADLEMDNYGDDDHRSSKHKHKHRSGQSSSSKHKSSHKSPHKSPHKSSHKSSHSSRDKDRHSSPKKRKHSSGDSSRDKKKKKKWEIGAAYKQMEIVVNFCVNCTMVIESKIHANTLPWFICRRVYSDQVIHDTVINRVIVNK